MIKMVQNGFLAYVPDGAAFLIDTEHQNLIL